MSTALYYKNPAKGVPLRAMYGTAESIPLSQQLGLAAGTCLTTRETLKRGLAVGQYVSAVGWDQRSQAPFSILELSPAGPRGLLGNHAVSYMPCPDPDDT